MCFRLLIVIIRQIVVCQMALFKWRWNLEPSLGAEVDDSSIQLFTKMREQAKLTFFRVRCWLNNEFCSQMRLELLFGLLQKKHSRRLLILSIS